MGRASEKQDGIDQEMGDAQLYPPPAVGQIAAGVNWAGSGTCVRVVFILSGGAVVRFFVACDATQ